MINYQLAKELKVAGFPQGTGDYACGHDGIDCIRRNVSSESLYCEKGNDLVFIPTLSKPEAKLWLKLNKNK